MGLQTTLPHKQQHATGASDALTPADINAATAANAMAGIQLFHSSQSSIPATGQTYYFGYPYDLAPVLAASITSRQFKFPYAATIRQASLLVTVTGTLGTDEGSGSINLFNVSTNSVVGALFTGQFHNTAVVALNAAVNLAVNDADHYSIQVVMPTFTTVPSAIRRLLGLYFTRP